MRTTFSSRHFIGCLWLGAFSFLAGACASDIETSGAGGDATGTSNGGAGPGGAVSYTHLTLPTILRV